MVMELIKKNKIMLKLVLIASIGILTSCVSFKERKTEKEAKNTQVEEVIQENSNVLSEQRPMREEDMIDIIGTVRMNKNGCPVLIEMVEGDLYSEVYPVNLEDEFKVDGKKIVFSYLPSRAKSVEGCNAERVIAVSNVVAK
jgi:hypothetical protein